MRVILAGTFDPAFARNRRLREFLVERGHDVVVCNVPMWGSDRPSLVTSRSVRLGLKLLVAELRLAARFVRTARGDLVVVQYPGWFDMFAIGLLARARRMPVLFDPFISLSDTVVSDRSLVSGRSGFARAMRFVDRMSLRLATRVLADTPEHAAFYSSLAGVALSGTGVVWVGADDELFRPVKAGPCRPHRVLFYGTFIPLHGIATIIEAARILEADGIEFRIIGDGQDRPLIVSVLERSGTSNVELVAPVPIERLVDEIAEATICLGIFGASDKAARVVPNKVFECVAVGRPVVTADTPAIRNAFPEGSLGLVPPADPAALAAEIRRLVADPRRGASMIADARRHYEQFYSGKRLAELFDAELRRTAGARRSPGPATGRRWTMPRREARDRTMGGRASRTPPLSLNARFRWDVVERLVRQHAPDSVLEIGPGRGAVAVRLARSMDYVGVEPDEMSRRATADLVAGRNGIVVAGLDEVGPDRRFAMVCAFEVLEHLADDGAMLEACAARLTPGGRIILSVPARRERFGAWDRRVGHLRRYDRGDVVDLVERSGLVVTGLWSTGWPVGRLLEVGRNTVARLAPAVGTTEQRTAVSGRLFQPRRVAGWLFAVVSPPMLWLHRRRFETDAGTGWVIECAVP